MNTIQFDHCLYSGNITYDFIIDLFKKKKISLQYGPLLLFLYLSSRISKWGKLKLWLFIEKKVPLDQCLSTFEIKLNKQILNLINKETIIITSSPIFLVEKALSHQIIGWNIDFKTKTLIPNQEKNIQKKIKTGEITLNQAIDTSYSIYLHFANKPYFYKNKKLIPANSKYQWIAFFTMIALSFLIMTITFLSATNPINWDLFESYYHDPIIVALNFLPIFMVMLVCYEATHQLWLSFTLTEIPFLALSYANFFKLKYRDYPVVFSDLTILSEAKIMAGKYDISPTKEHIEILLISIVIIFLLHHFFKKVYTNKKKDIFIILLILCGMGYPLKILSLSDQLYDNTGDVTALDNRWIEARKIQMRGLVYPFLYSYNYAYNHEPQNYNETEAIEILSQYTTAQIPQDQKINIVSIMLESYNDFTKFNLPFTEDIYQSLHQLQGEGLSGELVSNVFGGGTVNTERCFITGYFDRPLYYKNTNSYVHYFNSQGYDTVALHPCYGSFYNRRNINQYLGYDEFYYVENRYNQVSMDDVFFPDIIEEFEKHTNSGQPYFNYSLNYQGHGPYPSTDDDSLTKYLDIPDIDSAILNQLNYYFNGIKNTNDHLQELHDYFQNSDKPVVLVLFGDHNPVFGSGSEGFELLGINMDIGTEEGFKNYYHTPYVIWANDAAKAIIQDLPTNQIGPTISPNYLMNILFNYLGWTGPDYMQYTNTLLVQIPILHTEWKLNQDILDKFKIVEYYYYTNFND